MGIHDTAGENTSTEWDGGRAAGVGLYSDPARRDSHRHRRVMLGTLCDLQSFS